MMFSKKCKLHLDEADMTRWQHFKHAMGIAFRMEMAAGAVFLHAFAPRYFKTYASDVCKEIVKEK